MAWVYSHSLFCAHPHGDSPTRKGFFDSLLFGCIPVVLDRQDPAARGRAPFLPFPFALPWRNFTALLSRGEWMGAMVGTLQRYSPAQIRRMQQALASFAHLTQYTLPTSHPRNPPAPGPKPWSARGPDAGWVLRERHCAEDAFDMLTVALARDRPRGGRG